MRDIVDAAAWIFIGWAMIFGPMPWRRGNPVSATCTKTGCPHWDGHCSHASCPNYLESCPLHRKARHEERA